MIVNEENANEVKEKKVEVSNVKKSKNIVLSVESILFYTYFDYYEKKILFTNLHY